MGGAKKVFVVAQREEKTLFRDRKRDGDDVGNYLTTWLIPLTLGLAYSKNKNPQ